MKSTKTFNEMCNYTHELLTSLGYTYKIYAGLFRYYLGYNALFTIYIGNTHKSILKKVSFDSNWFDVETNINGEYEQYCIKELTDLAQKFVKLYKQNNIKKAIEEINKDFI